MRWAKYLNLQEKMKYGKFLLGVVLLLKEGIKMIKNSAKITVKPTQKVNTSSQSVLDTGSIKSIKKLASLTEKKVRELELRLNTLRNELSTAVNEKASSLQLKQNDESLIKGDDAEVAEKQRMNNSILQEIEIIRNRLKLIDRALNKMSLGIYGVCEESEEPIGYDRLLVVPWARFGVQVQEVRERTQKGFKKSRLAS